MDVYLDSVGGDHLEAAIGAIRSGGRIALVGAISTYNATEPAPGPNSLFKAAKQEATLLADGRLRTEETVVDGLDRAPEAFLGGLRGANTGKMLVRLAADA